MRLTSRTLFILCVGAIIAASPEAFAQNLCPGPKVGLKAGSPKIDAEAITFSYASKSYPVAIFSAYQSQRSGPGSNYCMRYEAENLGSAAIDKFFWPLASEMLVDELQPKERQSIITTVPPGYEPSIKETWVFAFVSSKERSAAYQQPISKETATQSPSRRQVASALPDAMTGTGSKNVALALKEPTKFDPVGTEFSTPTVDVSAVSTAVWNGKTFTITMTVKRNNEKYVSGVRAPLFYALLKSSDQKQFASAMSAGREGNIPLSDNTFSYSRTFAPNEKGSLFLVQQPITIDRPGGQVCFLAAAYSPVEVPEKFMTCDFK